MSDTTKAVLERAERSQRFFNLALACGAIVEAALIVTMLLLTNFADRTQALIFIAAVGGYTLVALGFIMLGAHVDRALLRALQARST